MSRQLASSLALALSALVVAAPIAGARSDAHAKVRTVTLVKGKFTNSAKYTGKGSVKVTRRGKVRVVRVARNFRADRRSIRLRMYLATDASGRKHVDLGPMRETGAQRFRVPKGVSLSRYRYVIGWCAAVNEPITQAKLFPVRRR